MADDAAGRLALRQRPAMWACCELGKISRRRSGLSRLRAGGDDPWRLRLRQGIPRRTLPARVPDPAHRPHQPTAHPQLHPREGVGVAEVVLMASIEFMSVEILLRARLLFSLPPCGGRVRV